MFPAEFGSEHPKSGTALKRGLVSIVLDPDDNRRVHLRDVLERQKVLVCESVSVDEAVRSISTLGPPDLLICAVEAWPKAGMEPHASSPPASDPARPYRVAILRDLHQALHALAAGADDFLVWPNAPEALQGRLRAILQQAALRVWMDTLRQAGAVVASAERLDGLFTNVASRLRRVLPVDHFIVARPENASVRFEIVDMVGAAPAPWTFCLRSSQSEACAQRFVPSPSGFRVCSHVRDADPRLSEGMRSCLCLPLMAQGRVVGSLSMASRQSDAFDVSIIPLMTSLAVQVSCAVANIERYEQALSETERLATILREVHHRIKNNLQGVVGLLTEHREATPVLATVLNNAISQLHTIASVHGLLSHQTAEQIVLSDLIRAIAAHSASLCRHDIQLETPDIAAKIQLPASEAVPFALVVNELIQNAIKHGYPGGRTGTIRVCLAESDGCLCLRVANDGEWPALPGKPTSSGLGLQLIRAMLPDGCSLHLHNHHRWTIAEVTLRGWIHHT